MWFKGILCIGCILFFCTSFVAALPNYFTTPTSTPAKIYWRVEDWNPSPSQTTQIPGQSPSPFPVTEPYSISTEKTEKTLNGKIAIVILFHNTYKKDAWDKTSRAINWIESNTPGKFELLSIGGTMSNAKFVDTKSKAITIQDSIIFDINNQTSINAILSGLSINEIQITDEADFIAKVKEFGKSRGGYDYVTLLFFEDSQWLDIDPKENYGQFKGNVVFIREDKNIGKGDLPYAHEILHNFGADENYNTKFVSSDGKTTELIDVMWYTTNIIDEFFTPLNIHSIGTETQAELGLRPELGLIFGNISFFDDNIAIIRSLPGSFGLIKFSKFEYTVSIEEDIAGKKIKIGDYIFHFDPIESRYEYAIALPPGNYNVTLSSDGYESSKKYPIIVKAGENNYKLKDERITLKRNGGWLGFPFSIG